MKIKIQAFATSIVFMTLILLMIPLNSSAGTCSTIYTENYRDGTSLVVDQCVIGSDTYTHFQSYDSNGHLTGLMTCSAGRCKFYDVEQ